MLDSKLSWQDHIRYGYNKIITFTSMFYKTRERKINPVILKMLYFVFRYHHLLYDMEIYGNSCESHNCQGTHAL